MGDVRLSLEFADPDLTVSFTINNVTDRAYRVFNSDNSFIGLAQSTYGVLVTAVQKVPLSKLLKHSDKSRDKIVTD